MTVVDGTLQVWHASTLSRLLRCGEAYRRSALERDHPPPTTPQLRGTAVHRGVGAGLLEAMRTGTTAPVELFEDVAASEIDRARHGGATLTAEEASAGVARTFGVLKDRVVRYAGHYGRVVAPTMHPVAVERRISVADAVPGVVVRGTLDCVDRDDQGEIIVDAKTTERAPAQDVAERSQQLTMYSLLRVAEHGTPDAVSRVALDYLVQNRSTGQVGATRYSSTRGPRDRSAIVARVQAGLRAVQAGVFLPANPDTDWWCSERWCEYFNAGCPFAIRGRG